MTLLWVCISSIVFIILALDTYKEKSGELWFVITLLSIAFPFGILLIVIRRTDIDE